MLNRLASLTCTLTALWLALTLTGKAAESPALTVSAAVAEAVRNNAELRLLRAHIETVRGSARAAATYPFNPEAVYTEGLDRHLGISQALEWPGKRALREALAKGDIEAAEIAAAGFKIAVAAEVRTACFEWLAAREQAVTAEDECQTAQLIADAARQRVDKGFAPPSEDLKARAELVNAARQRQAAQQAVVLAGMTLNQLLGRASDAPPPELIGTLHETPPELPLATILNAALAGHPDLHAQLVDIRKAEAGISLARKERGPDIGIEAFYEQNARDTAEQKAGFGVTVPLPVWSSGGAGIASARAVKSEAELSLEKTRGEVSVRVRRAYVVFTGAERDAALFSPELSRQLEAQSRAAREKYAAGECTLLALVDLQQTRRNYLKDHTDALLAVCRAWSELEEAAGIPLEELK